MSSEQARAAVWAELVSALLHGRRDRAGERFDTEVVAAVESGALSADTAAVLTFWHRAAVRGLSEHVRTVLPAVLQAMEAAAEAEESYVMQAEPPTSPQQPVAATAQPAPAKPGSTPVVELPSSLEERRRRMIVAGLTTVSQTGPAPGVGWTQHRTEERKA